MKVLKFLLVFIVFIIPINTYCEEAFQLGEVVVSGEKEDVAKATTVSEITAEDIKKRGCKNVAEALDMIPGVDVRLTGKGQMEVYIRGFVQDDVKILIDGVPAYETCYRYIDLSQFPVDSIAKIKVIKGASSVLYRSNTMGGVINIITKKGSKEPTAFAKAAFGDYDTRHYAVGHGWEIKNINYFFTYAYQESDGFRLSSDFDENDPYVGLNSPYEEDGGKRDLSDYRKNAFNAKVGYDTDKAKIYLSFDYHTTERGIPTEYHRYWRFTDWKQWHLNLVSEQNLLDDKLKFKERIFYVDHDDTLTSYKDKKETEIWGKWFDKSQYDDYSLGGEFQVHYKIKEISLFKLRFSYIFDQHKQRDYNKRKKGKPIYPGWTDWDTYETETYSLGIEDEIYLGKFTIIVGFSYDWYNPIESAEVKPGDTISTINPQIGIVYKASDSLSFHSSLGKKTRFPHMKELYSEHAGGNPDLDPQKTYAFEIGMDKLFSLTRGWQGGFSFSFFYNKVKDLIDRVDLPNGEPQYQNIGEAKIYGTETTFNIQKGGLLIDLYHTYLYTKDEEKDRELEGRPRHKFGLDFRYSFPFGLSIASQLICARHQYEYIYERKTKEEITRRLPDYYIINLRISQTIKKHITVFGEITNLTDKNYDEGSGPMPGRNFMIGIEAKL